MTVAFDATGGGWPGSAATGAGTANTFSDTTTSGDDVFLAITVDRQCTLSGVTYNGTSMTLLGSVPGDNLSSNSTIGTINLYHLASAGTGSSVTVSFTTSVATWTVAKILSYSGVVSVGTAQTSYGNSSSLSSGSIACSTGQIVLNVLGFADDSTLASLASPSGGTNRYLGWPSASGANGCGMSVSDATSTTTFTVSSAPINTSWASISVVLSGSGNTVSPGGATISTTVGTPTVTTGSGNNVSPGGATIATTRGTPTVSTGSGNSVTFDATGGFSSQSGSAITTLSGTQAAGVGDYILLALANVPYYGAISAVTCDGTAMTLLGTSTESTGVTEIDLFYYGVSITSAGNHTIQVTSPGTYMTAQAVVLSGVGSHGTALTTGSGGASLSQTVSGLTAGQLVVQSFATRGWNGSGTNGGATGYTGGTLQWSGGFTIATGEIGAGLSISTSSTAGSTTFAANISASITDNWSGLAIVFSPPSGTTETPGTATITTTSGTPTIPNQPTVVSPGHATITTTVGSPLVTGPGPLSGVIGKLSSGQNAIIQTLGDSTCYGDYDTGYSYVQNQPGFTGSGNLYGWAGRMALAIGEYFNANVQLSLLAVTGSYAYNVAYNYPSSSPFYYSPVTLYTATGTGRPTLTVYHGGWPGSVTANITSEISTILPVSNPDAVIINIGFNETNTTTFASNFSTLISDIQSACPGAPIIATTENATTITSESGHGILFTAIFDAMLGDLFSGVTVPMSPPLQKATAVSGVWALDTMQAGQTSADLYSDGLHPNATGYGMQAAFMLQQLAPGVPFVVTPASATITAIPGTPTITGGTTGGGPVTVSPTGATGTITPGSPAVTAPDRVSPGTAPITTTPGTPGIVVMGSYTASPGSANIVTTPGSPQISALGGSGGGTTFGFLDEISNDPENPTNFNLRPFQYQIGNFVFGRYTDVPVTSVDIDTYNINNQDFQVIRTDERQFGIDTLAPSIITFKMGIMDNSPLPNILGLTGDELPPSLVARNGVILPALAKEWKANEVRPIWGETKPIFFCDADGITRRIYGRPGKFKYTRTSIHNAWFDVTAEYRRSDTYAHSDNEYYVGPVAPGTPIYAARQGGDADCWFRILLAGPFTNPIITIGSLSIAITASVNDGTVMEISSYPWIRRIIDSNGNNWRAYLNSPTYLDQLIFPAYDTVNISWTTKSGTPTNADTKLIFLWREAYNIV